MPNYSESIKDCFKSHDIIISAEWILEFLFSPWPTYCEIFHTYKPMGFYLGGLYNMKTRYHLDSIGGVFFFQRIQIQWDKVFKVGSIYKQWSRFPAMGSIRSIY